MLVNKMKNRIIEGGTGSGKTHYSIESARELGRFAYVAPCRLLAYETYIKYSNDGDKLSTGLCSILGKNNFYGTYHSIKTNAVKNYDCIIIDEAHWISGTDNHSKKIKELVAECEKHEIACFLVTATRDFKPIPGFSVINLNAKELLNKSLVDIDEAKEKMFSGAQTLIICSSIRDANDWSDYLDSENFQNYAIATRDYDEYHIFQAMQSFRKKEISTLTITNIAAQGLNLPCENLILDLNIYDGIADLRQKLGRLGRPFMGMEDKVLTYAYTSFLSERDEEAGYSIEHIHDFFSGSSEQIVLTEVNLFDQVECSFEPYESEYPCFDTKLAIFKAAKNERNMRALDMIAA